MPTKILQSKIGRFEMAVPEAWRTDTDGDPEKLIFAFDFWKGSYTDYVAIRAEQFSLGSLLLGELALVPASSSVANSWSVVTQQSVTPEEVAVWIMRHKSRAQALAQGKLQQGSGGRVVPTSEEDDGSQNKRKDSVVDARILDGGAAAGGQGSALFFHVRTTVPRTEDEPDVERPSRYWSVKAILQNGTISVGYVTANEEHFLAGAEGPLNGPFLDNIAGSLRLMPQQA